MTDAGRPRIAFLLSSLHFGGGERVALNLAAALRTRGYTIDILLMQAVGELLGEARRDFTVIDLQCGRTWQLPGALARYLRRNRPVALISSFWKLNLCACLARIASPRTRLAVWEHSPPSRSANSPDWAYCLTASLLYRLATRVIAVSHDVAQDIRGISVGLGDRISVIFNAVPAPPRCVDADVSRRGHRILWVGRFAEPKNPGLMIEAFSLLEKGDRHLHFLGDGPLRAALEEQVKARGLEDQVRFLGFQAGPHRHMAQADLLVISSDREGLPTVLVEALHAGLAVVSTDCGAGVRDILADGRYGAIVPPRDAGALAAAIERQLLNPPDPEEQRRATRRFDPDLIAGQFAGALGLTDLATAASGSL